MNILISQGGVSSYVAADSMTMAAENQPYKMSQGVSGRMVCGMQVHLDKFSGDHVGIYIAPTLGKCVRTGSIPPGGPLNAGVVKALNSARANGVEVLWGMSTSNNPVLPYADLPAWENYLRTTIATVKATWPEVKWWEWKNEPAFNGTITAQALAQTYPIIKSADPDGLVFAPSQLLLGFTVGRQQWVPQFIAAGGLDNMDVFCWHVYGSYGPPETAYNWDMRWVMSQVLKLKPNMKFAISEFGWQDNKDEETYGTGHEYAPPEKRQNYIPRAWFIHRSLPNMIVSSMYMANDTAGTGFGLFDALRAPKPAQRYAKDALAHINTWKECSSYTKGITFPSMDPVMAHADKADVSPWYVKGTLDNGTEEMAFWHPSVDMADNFIVEVSEATNLTLQTIGSLDAPVSVPVPKGLSKVSALLTKQPCVYSAPPGVMLRFPEYR